MRKKIIALSMTLLLVVSFLVGCGGQKKEITNTADNKKVSQEKKKTDNKQQGSTEKKSDFNEAPMLAKMVKESKLPSIEKRLPVKEDIMIEKPYEEIGQYGGEWRNLWGGIDDKWGPGMITEEPLFRFREDGNGIEPNVAKGYDVNKDATEYTIYLRKGMKWSDGEPFTADDVIFYWEHMLLKQTFGKKLYNCYYSVDPKTGDKAVCTVEKVDDYTVKIKHKYPNALFLERVAIDNKWFFAPAHFYKKILPEFIGEEKALAKAKEWGFSDIKGFGKWTGYYYWIWAKRPTLRPWVAKNDPNSDRFIMERNPYYWKTDTEGNQLPYIDRLVYDRTEDAVSHSLMEGIAGKLNCSTFNFSDFTVLKENEKAGDYRILKWPTAAWCSTCIQLNQTVENPKLRKLFQDIRFREALSVAVDRNEVSEIVTNGLADPQQASVPKGLPNYQEGWAKKWAEYDLDKANQLLDEIGLKWDSEHKYRKFSDGSDFAFVIYQQNDEGESSDKYVALLKKYYEAVGIKTNIKVVDKSLLHELKYNNKLTASLEGVGLVKVAYRPDCVVPLRVLTPWYGHYGLYNSSNGKEGIKPEGDVAKLLEYWDNVISSKNTQEINKWCDEIIKLHEKNQWIIGYTGPSPALILVKNNFRNVPKGIYCDEFRGLGHARPLQFFIKK